VVILAGFETVFYNATILSRCLTYLPQTGFIWITVIVWIAKKITLQK